MEKQRITLRRESFPLNNTVVRRMSVRGLLQNAKTLILEHQGQDYTLRVTRNGKLILTK